MSSSADPGLDAAALGQAPPPLGWPDFEPREEVLVPAEFISPESELLSLARRYEDELRRCREHSEQAANAVREVIFDLAVHVGRLEQLVAQATEIAEADEPLAEKQHHKLRRQLGVLKNQMLDTLRRGGVEVRDPMGLPATQVMEWADVADWLYRDEFTHEVVARTQQAAVFHAGAAVRLALVVMGAPLAQDGALDAASTADAPKTSDTPDTEGVPDTRKGGDR